MDIAGAIKELAGVLKVWLSGAERRRKSALYRTIEQFFDYLEPSMREDKKFQWYKKRIRAYL